MLQGAFVLLIFFVALSGLVFAAEVFVQCSKGPQVNAVDSLSLTAKRSDVWHQ